MAFYGMEIHTCLSGAEAIELVRTNRYDIVFMDQLTGRGVAVGARFKNPLRTCARYSIMALWQCNIEKPVKR